MSAPIKLIGLDFDNTLYDGENSLTPVQPWFERLRDRGIQLGLVTGRTFGSLQRLFEADQCPWGNPFPDFAICFESRILTAQGESIEGCEHWNRERDTDVEGAHGIIERELPAWSRELAASGILCQHTWLDSNYGVYLEFESPEKAVAACAMLQQLADPAHPLRFVRNYSGLSIHAKNRSKGPALAKLLEAWKIPQAEVLVIGDSFNDLCMMNGDYHYQVATVANADPAIHEAVTKKKGIISEKPCSRGVIDIFEKLF
jgi:hydroxymethylpyrimidine pyrophosphatase-like HAD family hydrolase